MSQVTKGAKHLYATAMAAAPRNPERAPVMVFDEEGAGFLAQTILPGIPHSVLPVRGEKYFLSPGMVSRISRRIRSVHAAAKPGELAAGPRGEAELFNRAYLLAATEIAQPKVVVTFIDNRESFHWLSRNYPAATFIAVQNGSRLRASVRDWLPPRPRAGSIISIPHFYCFSRYERELYEDAGHDVGAFYPVGSVKADYYRSDIAPGRKDRRRFDLCMVSEWEASLFSGNSAFPAVTAGLTVLYSHLEKFVAGHNGAVAVALRSDDPAERAFFERIFRGKAAIIPSDRKAYSTYAAMDDSGAIVALNSTAAREAFGWGKRVLFGNFTGDPGYGPPRGDELWLVENTDYAALEKALDRILAMPDSDFSLRARRAMPYMMHHDPSAPAHRVISAHVRQLIGGKEAA